MKNPTFEPTWTNQLAHARRLMVEQGYDAVWNPHGMIGATCHCMDCFTCAAYQVCKDHDPEKTAHQTLADGTHDPLCETCKPLPADNTPKGWGDVKRYVIRDNVVIRDDVSHDASPVRLANGTSLYLASDYDALLSHVDALEARVEQANAEIKDCRSEITILERAGNECENALADANVLLAIPIKQVCAPYITDLAAAQARIARLEAGLREAEAAIQAVIDAGDTDESAKKMYWAARQYQLA